MRGGPAPPRTARPGVPRGDCPPSALHSGPRRAARPRVRAAQAWGAGGACVVGPPAFPLPCGGGGGVSPQRAPAASRARQMPRGRLGKDPARGWGAPAAGHVWPSPRSVSVPSQAVARCTWGPGFRAAPAKAAPSPRVLPADHAGREGPGSRDL